MSTKSHAAMIAERMAMSPHPSTHTLRLRECRQCFPCVDTGTDETFTLLDGSRLRYDHTANPGFQWSEV